MKKFIFLLTGCFFWMYCAKDLLVYPQLDTQLNLHLPDSVILKTDLKNLDAGIRITEAGYIWSFSAQSPTHAGGYDGAYQVPEQADYTSFYMQKGGFPLNVPVYFRGYVLISDRDTVYGRPVSTTTGKIELSTTAVAANGDITVISTINGLPPGGKVGGHGHLWLAVGVSFSPSFTLTTPGVLFSYQDEPLPGGQFTESLTDVAAGTPYLIRSYVFYRGDTLYSNLLETRTGNVCQRIPDFPGSYLWGTVSFVIGNKAFVGTGEILPTSFVTKNKGLPTCNFWMFDPQSNTWTAVAPFPGKARYNAAAFVIDGKAYVGTGRDHTQTFQDFYVYTPPPQDRWDTIADYPLQIMGAAAFAINGRGYLSTGAICTTDFSSGGLPYCTTFDESTFEYRPEENEWYKKADYPVYPDNVLPRVFAVGFSIGSKGYVGTGLTPNYFSPGFYEFDPNNGPLGKWTRRANLGNTDYGQSRLGAVGFSIGGYGYIGTGSTYNFPTYNDLWQYDPVADLWTQKANIGNLNREFSTAFVLEDKAYIGLGFIRDNQNRASREFWKYYPD